MTTTDQPLKVWLDPRHLSALWHLVGERNAINATDTIRQLIIDEALSLGWHDPLGDSSVLVNEANKRLRDRQSEGE